MIEALRTLINKLLALVLLGVLAYSAVALVIKPISTQHADLEDGIETQRALLGHLQAAAEQAKTVHDSKTQLDPANKGPVFLEGESDAIRISSLQSKLSDAAQSIGARLSSTQAVQARDTNGVRLVGVQTQFSTTIEQLQKFLFDIETARPMMFVETLHVSRGPDRDGQEISDLDVRLVVLGATPREKGQP